MSSASASRHAFALAVFGLLLAACGGPGGSIEACVGSYSGTYAGDTTGTTTAILDLERDLEVSFVASGGDETTAVFTVTSSNTLARDRGRLDLDGTFDIDACTLDGSWALAADSGTYGLKKVE